MSAQLQGEFAPNRFTAHLALAAGVTASIHAPTLADLSLVVAKLQGPANDSPEAAPASATGKAASAARPAPAPTSAPAAAGNVPASTPTQASAQPADSGSAAGGDAPTGSGFTYDHIRDRVLAIAKKDRNKAVEALGKFTGQNGKPATKGQELKLEDYAAFMKATDEVIGA
jgi:predicted component of type VI protein secretion system